MRDRDRTGTCRALAMTFVLACHALAQQPVPTAGTFVDATGQAIAGATVTLATGSPTAGDAIAPAELVTATTDATGRFRATLRHGRAYSAWAIGPGDERGFARSAVVEGIRAGQVVELQEVARAKASTFALRDLANLHGMPPFRLVVRVGARHGPTFPLPLDDQGRAELPPLPAAPCPARVIDRGDRVLWTGYAWGGADFPVPEYRAVTVEVHDGDGKPVAGAAVTVPWPQFVGSPLPFVGTATVWPCTTPSAHTDAAGKAQVWLPTFVSDVLVQGPDGSEAIVGALGGHAIVDGALAPETTTELPTTLVARLRAAPPLRGRVRRGDVPLANAAVQLSVDIRLSCRTQNATVSGGRSRDLARRSDAAGAFAVPQPTSAPWCVPTVDTGLDQPPNLWLPVALPSPRPLDLDVAALADATLLCTDAEGNPALDATVALQSGDPTHPWHPTCLLPDRGGRLRVRLQPGNWFVFASDGRSGAAQLLAIAGGPAPQTVPLHLPPLARMAGHTKQAQRGSAKPTAYGGGTSYDPQPDQPLLALLHAHGEHLNRGLLQTLQVADDGAFSLRFLAIPRWTMHLSIGGAATTLQEATDLDLTVDQRR